MAKTNKFEEMLEHLVNNDRSKAEELFHEIVVEKSRDIYENLLADDIEDEEVDEASKDDDKEVDEASKDDDKEVDEASKDDDDEKTNEDFDLDEFEVEADPMGGDAGDDMEMDMGMDGEEGEDDMDMDNMDGEEGEGDVDDKIQDLEDELADLKAEFEELEKLKPIFSLLRFSFFICS